MSSLNLMKNTPLLFSCYTSQMESDFVFLKVIQLVRHRAAFSGQNMWGSACNSSKVACKLLWLCVENIYVNIK